MNKENQKDKVQRFHKLLNTHSDVKAGGWECGKRMGGARGVLIPIDVGWGNGVTVRESLPCYNKERDG